MANYIGHLKTVCKHKYWVFHYCRKAGIPWRGLVHDLSKFSPIEFIEGAKYYDGTRSPINVCKEQNNGVSRAWLHHKGRNKHHYEYWVDSLDKGGVPLQMPFKYACELICDYLGAARAYMGKDFSYTAELKWWDEKRFKPLAMTESLKCFITLVFMNLSTFGDNALSKENLKRYYDLSIKISNKTDVKISTVK